MYGFQGGMSANTTKPFWIFVGMVLVGAVIAGMLLAGAELFNPSLNTAKAEKLRAETAALQAQTAYERRQREIELRKAEEATVIELQALRDRRAREAELLEFAGIVGLVTSSAVAIVLTVAASYYVVAKARISMKGQATDARYERFLDFCENRVLSNGRQPLPLDYSRWNNGQSNPSGKMSLAEVRTFFLALKGARIIKRGSNGYAGWVLDKRISDIADIRYRISPEAFDKIA
jgi:hypothetical protein